MTNINDIKIEKIKHVIFKLSTDNIQVINNSMDITTKIISNNKLTTNALVEIIEIVYGEKVGVE